MTAKTNAERMLDKTLADTFPASDPLSTLPNPSFDSFEFPAREAREAEDQKVQRAALKPAPAERKSA